uniref:Uncharacterized protein n=1 Tax=Romanomermis culicivorax TaxID=13658 RepID=A0A915IS81_ROMCU
QLGQDSAEEVKNKDLKKTLEEKEKSRDKRGLKDSQSSSSSRKRQEDISAGNLDADDPLDLDEDEDVESDEDDTAALMAELNKIKKEREAEKIQQ